MHTRRSDLFVDLIRWSVLACATCFTWVGSARSVVAQQTESPQRELVVTASLADVKVGTELVTRVRAGNRYEILQEAPGWFYIRVPDASGEKRGWIQERSVRVVDRVLELIEAGNSQAAVEFATLRYRPSLESDDASGNERLRALNRMGLAKLSNGDYQEAAILFRQSLAETEKALGDRTPEVAEAINNLAVSLYNAGDLPESQALLERALQMRRGLLGPTHPDTVRSSLNLLLLQSQGQLETLDWEVLTRIADQVKSLAVSGGSYGSNTAADLHLMREVTILPPQLKMQFSAPGYDDGPLFDRPLPVSRAAAQWVSRLALLTNSHGYFREAARVAEQVYGRGHFQTLLAQANLAAEPEFPFGSPDMIPSSVFPERIALLENTAAGLQRVQANSGLQAVSVNHNLGVALLSMRPRRDEAMRVLRSVLDTLHQWDAEHPRTGFAHETLGLAGYIVGDFDTATNNLNQAVAIYQRKLGEGHRKSCDALNSLGAAHFQVGNLPQARQHVETAWRLRSENFGPDSSLAHQSVNDLGVILGAQGDYVGARRLLEHSLESLRSSPQFDDFLRQQMESNLWVLRLQMGDYAPAEAYFKGILRSEETFLHKDAFVHLATLARLQNRLPEARSYLERAIQQAPYELQLKNDLGAVYRELGDYRRAASILTEVLQARLQDEFADKSAVAFSQTSLALVEQRRGNYDAARNLLQRASVLLDQELGPQHPRTTEVLRILGETELLANRNRESQAYLERALGNKLQLADTILPTLSEAEALAYIVAFDERDLLLESLSGNAAASYEVVWKTRSLATRALAPRAPAYLDDPDLRRLQVELRGVRRQLSNLVLQSQDTMDAPLPEERKQSIERLSTQKEDLERKLAAGLSSESAPSGLAGEAGTTARELLEKLPEDVAVVDLLRTHRVQEPSGWYYQAFVLRGVSSADGNPPITQVDLGPADAIDSLVTSFRSELLGNPLPGETSAGNGQQASGNSTASRRLQQLVWRPLEAHLGPAKTVLIVPDGTLTSVPWSALPKAEGQGYLVEEYAIATAAFPHQILELLKPFERHAAQRLLAGGIDYFDRPSIGQASPQKAGPTRGEAWTPLPGTASEVTSIAGISEETALVLQGTEASETRLLTEMPRSRYIHLATHGYFAEPQTPSITNRQQRDNLVLTELQMTEKAMFSPVVARLEAVTGRNPLLLSGLVLAGANVDPVTNEYGAPLGEDGVLTAEEVAGLDLRNTELVVLSACETGLGKVAGGEGVFGLQRSFAMAGARSTISSLWKVDDQATAALMEKFYQNLWQQGMSKLEALRQAQLWMLREAEGQVDVAPRGRRLVQDRTPEDEKQLPPYYWAAFVLSGDWQ